MIKTYEIDFEDSLVESASEVFEKLGTDIDTAITMFLKQAVLRKGFPFEVVVPELEEENISEAIPTEAIPAEELKSEEHIIEENPINEISSEEKINEEIIPEEVHEDNQAEKDISDVVAANELLVAEMRSEIGEDSIVPEFDENEDDGTHGDYESSPVPLEENKVEAMEAAGSQENPEDDDEDEDETTPDNLFDAWESEDESNPKV